MPISTYALTQEQAFFRAAKTDGLVTRMGKFTFGTALTTTACMAAIFETVLSAMAAAVTYPVLYAVGSNRRYVLVNYTRDSASTAAAAARRTFGADIPAAQVVENPPKPVQLPRMEELKTRAKDLFQQALSTGKAHKGQLLGTAAVAAIVATAYYADLFGMVYNLVAPAKEYVPPHYVIGNQCFLTNVTYTAKRAVTNHTDNSSATTFLAVGTLVATPVVAVGALTGASFCSPLGPLAAGACAVGGAVAAPFAALVSTLSE